MPLRQFLRGLLARRIDGRRSVTGRQRESHGGSLGIHRHLAQAPLDLLQATQLVIGRHEHVLVEEALLRQCRNQSLGQIFGPLQIGTQAQVSA